VRATIDRRYDDIKTGKVTLIDGEELRREMKARTQAPRPVRFRLVGNYLIAYAPDESPVWVIAVLHTRIQLKVASRVPKKPLTYLKFQISLFSRVF
jgi:hypothetical protein